MSWVARATIHELRARRDVALAAAGVGAAAALLASATPALEPAAARAPLLERGGAGLHTLAAVLLLVLGVRAAAGLSSPPRGDPLAALPVRPGAARAARLLACALALLAAPLARHAAGLGHALLVGPIPDSTAWAARAALDLAQVAVALAAGATARLLGPLAWPALGVGALGLALGARLSPLDPLLDPLRLGMTPPTPALGLLAGGAWLLAAGIVLAAALALGPRFEAGPARRLVDLAFAREGFGHVNARLVALLGPLLVAAPALCAAAPRAPFVAGRPALDEGPLDMVSARTRRYRFTYPASLAAPARALVQRADAVHDAVVALLGLPLPDPAAAPLELALEPTGELAGDDPCAVVTLDAAAAASLAHVTCHALLARAGALDRERTWVLEEGLAQHAGWRATGDDPFATRFVAAVLHARRPFGEDEHLQLTALERTRGREAAAYLGEAFVEAARRLGGDAAVRDLVAGLLDRAAQVQPAALGAEGARARWTAILARAGLDPAAMREAVLAVIEDEAPRDPRAQLDLPRLFVVEDLQESRDLKVFAIPDAPLPPDWDVVCRVLLDPTTADARPQVAARLGLDRSGCFAFSRRHELLRLGPRPRVQVGVRPLRQDGPFRGTIWEEWVQLPMTP